MAKDNEIHRSKRHDELINELSKVETADVKLKVETR
jgi:hypothetical protein